MENNLSIVKNQFKELPNNIEAEQAVIGSILVTNDLFDEISATIESSNFYDPMHQKIYAAIENLIARGMLANPITLKNYFEDEKDDLNVPEYLVKITKYSTSSRQTIEYAKIIKDMFVRRELIKISEETIDNAKLTELDQSGQNIIEDSEKKLFDLDTAIQEKNFWNNKDEAEKILKKKKSYDFLINSCKYFEKENNDLYDIYLLAKDENDNQIIKETINKFKVIKEEVKKLEIKCFLSNENDILDAYLEFHAGAGGSESQDWALMLRRMYMKWGS